MNAYEKIVQSISPLGYPYEPEVYKGASEYYFTYNYADDRGALYADNEPQTTVASVQVHFFMPTDKSFTKIKRKIRSALFQNGFTFPVITVLTEDDKKIRHIIFECDIEEDMEE